MKKIRIIKNNEIIFESSSYITYDNKKYIEFDFADLSNANLCDADLSKADLSDANLCNANLCNANLRYADLSDANLCNANLCNANLRYANLCDANLNNADLSNANLNNADLSNADLRYADLSKADLSNANLCDANLNNANLSKADLSYANLRYADLAEEEQIRKGKIIKDKIVVYKKCQEKIVELELQGGSIVFSINNYKCRTNKAKVISIDGKKTSGLKIESNYDENFVYEVGKIVEVKDFNLMYNVECAEGIHFFFKKEDAKNYNN